MTRKQIFIFIVCMSIGYSPFMAHHFGAWVFIPASLLLLAIIAINVQDFRVMRAHKRWMVQQEINSVIQSGWRNVKCSGGCGETFMVNDAMTTYDHCCFNCQFKRAEELNRG